MRQTIHVSLQLATRLERVDEIAPSISDIKKHVTCDWIL